MSDEDKRWKKDSRTAFVNIGIYKNDDGRICIYGASPRPEAAFGVLMTPEIAQTFARSVFAVVDGCVLATGLAYIRAELL